MNDMPATDPLHRAFCENVRARRKLLGLRQEDVAARLGMTTPSYNAIEKGKCAPTLPVVRRVAEALETDHHELTQIPTAAIS